MSWSIIEGMSDSVETRFRYGRDTGQPRARAMNVNAFLEFDESMFENVTAMVKNGRPGAGTFSIDKEGFELKRSGTSVRDFYSKDEVESLYYPEVEALIKQVTGASRVVVFDHTLRTGDRNKQLEKQIREPVMAVHNDYTEDSAPQRVRDLLPDEADALLKHRFQVVQVWRPVHVPAVRSPLGICDASSINKKDLLRTELHYGDRVGEIYHIAYNPSHQWFYFPVMQPDEALVFKCYDSLANGCARFTAHSAFEDPTTPDNAPARESIEARALAFFEE